MPRDGGTLEKFSEVMVASGGQLLGSIRIADVLRSEATAAVAEMRKLGLRVVLLTGDRKEIADATAKELGVDEVHSEMMPDQKVARVRQLRAEGRVVAMIGEWSERRSRADGIECGHCHGLRNRCGPGKRFGRLAGQ